MIDEIIHFETFGGTRLCQNQEIKDEHDQLGQDVVDMARPIYSALQLGWLHIF